MKYIQYSVARRETGNASGKAKKDASDIALQKGFLPSYKPSKYQPIRVLQQYLSMGQYKQESVVFMQYPGVNEKLIDVFVKTKSPRTKTIALIHDLLCIQGITEWPKEKDSKYLSYFDCVIVHNLSMKRFVEDELGYKGYIVVLELFDYLHDYNRGITKPHKERSISFAGNLAKAPFLTQLEKVNTCKFLLYGNNGGEDYSGLSNVEYKGLLPSDEIQYLLEGDYGLVWDGDTIDTCSGLNGVYLHYNNPHKLSLCMAAGKPVVTWRKAAIAEFINKYNVGVVVDSLEELNGIDLNTGYEEMRNNVLQLKKKVAEGWFLKRAIDEALAYIN